MKKELAKSFLSLKTAIKKHSPEILTGIGIAGMITTTVMAVRATPKALILIEERKEEIGAEKLEAMDMVKTAWACYIPAAITGTLSVACLIGASSVNARRNAALATAYTLSESALKNYQGKVIEMFGEKKNEAVKDAIAKDMTFAMGNCIVMEDTNGNRKLLKKRYDAKIDAVAAMMDAFVAFKLNRDAFE